MNETKPDGVELLYISDPMCSWCWGFSRVFQTLIENLPKQIKVKRFVGGLAPDSDEPMPEATKLMVQQAWQRIQQNIPGTEFNYDFWEKCQPRRSTYPACRAVIAAREQGIEFDEKMTRAIQQAYYLNASNPSDDAVLIRCAESIEVDVDRFKRDYFSDEINSKLLQEIAYCRSIGADSFPNLIFKMNQRHRSIALNYTDADVMLSQIVKVLSSSTPLI